MRDGAIDAERGQPRRILAVLLLAGGCYSFLQSLVVPALPVFQRELGTTPTGTAWIFTTYLIAACVATPLAGRFGDMFGKKRVLLCVLAILAAGIALAAVSNSLWLMLVARTLQGAGGAIFPLAFGIIRDELPAKRVAGGIALMSGVLGFGGVLGIVSAGPILHGLSIHWLFWLPLAVTLTAIVATFAFVPESEERAPGEINWVAAGLLSGWLVCLLLAISEAPAWGWLSTPTVTLMVAAAALAVAWVTVELRARFPLVDMRVMTLNGGWTTHLAAILIGGGMYSGFVLLPQFVQTPGTAGFGFDSNVTQAGFFLLPWTIGVLVSSPISGRLSTTYGSRLPLACGSIISAVALVGFAALNNHPWELYTASALMGIGVGFAFSSLANRIVETVPSAYTGVASGMNVNLRSMGGAIGTQISATIVAATVASNGYPTQGGYTGAFVFSAVMLFAAVLAVVAKPGRRRALLATA